MANIDRKADIGSAWSAFARQPDEDRFHALHDAAAPLVWTICRRLLRRDEDAHDAMQSAWMRLFLLAQHPDYKSQPYSDDEAHQLICRTAAREADALRKRLGRRARKEIPMGELPLTNPGGESPSEIAAARETRARLETLVQTLPDKYRAPVLLHYFDGLTQAQIAGMLGLTPAGVSLRLKRALKKLTPLARRAGLGEALGALGGTGLAGAALLTPPAAVSAAEVWIGVQTAVASGAASLGAGAALAGGAKGGLAAGILKFKVGLAAIVLGGAAMLTLPIFQPGESPRPQPQAAVVAPAMPEAISAPDHADHQSMSLPALDDQDAEPSATNADETSAVMDESAILDPVNPDEIPPANPAPPSGGLRSTLTNLPSAILPAQGAAAPDRRAEHTVKARLEFDGPVSSEILEGYKFASIRLVSTSWWNFLGADGANLHDTAQANIKDGIMEFRGRFRGKYQLTLAFDFGAFTYYNDPKEIKLNNLRRDQDLGAIRLPALAGLGVQIDLDTSEMPEPPREQFLSIWMAGRSQAQNAGIYWSESTRDQVHRLFVPPGEYTVYVQCPGWEMKDEAIRIELKAGTGPIPAIVARLTPQGEIRGWMFNCVNISIPVEMFVPDRVIIKGPDGLAQQVDQQMSLGGRQHSDLPRAVASNDNYLIGSEFSFRRLPPGEYVVSVEKNGCDPYVKTIAVVAGDVAYVSPCGD